MTEMEKQVEQSILRVMVTQVNWVYPALVLSPRDFKIFTKYDQYDRVTNYRVVAEKSFKDHYFEVYLDPKQPDGVMKFSHPVLGTKEVRVPLLGVVPWVGAPSTRNKPRRFSRSFKGKKCGTLVRETSTWPSLWFSSERPR